MAENKVSDSCPSPGDKHLPVEIAKLTTNLFKSEKNLIKLRQALPIEKQDEYIRRIQAISKKRVSFLSTLEITEATKEALLTIGSIQEEYNDCLQQIISDFLEESEAVDYQEHEPAMKLLRQKSITKGMIVGNYNEIIEGMDRILSTGENLIVQGYQKLFIDSGSIKEKLQAVIDDRKNLPVGNKPMETLMLKQNFCERQLDCLLMLFQEANTLTDLISKLQEFDTKQIQFQKTSQVTVDAMKKFFYLPDVRKSNERRRTYLTVSYANPDNTREGLGILKDQINSIVRNINVVCDMEDGKVRAINKSYLGDKCENEFDLTKEIIEEERELITRIFDVLKKNEDDVEIEDQFENILNSLTEVIEKPDNQLACIKYFTDKGLADPKKRLELSKFLVEMLEKYEESVTKNTSLLDKLQAEVAILSKENTSMRSQLEGRVIEKISEGTHSLKELFDYQEQLKKSIQESIENQISQQIIESLMISGGTAEILLGVNPDDDIKARILEYETDYARTSAMPQLLEIILRYQSSIFRLVAKLGLLSEGHIHANLSNLRKCRTLKEARESLIGKPSEYPLASMDKTLSEILKSYLLSLDEKKGSIESVIRKQNVLGRLFRDFKG